jgi:hypothetical protein
VSGRLDGEELVLLPLALAQQVLDLAAEARLRLA